jgi:glycosyltransferase involved in cell wall biosynthesis
MDKISIITVSYNAENTIRATIESVLNQTYQNIEYILIDGKSTDNTYKIICEYDELFNDKGIRYFHISEPDNGIYDAMNKALDYCTGDWVQYMNANDTEANPKVLSQVFKDNYDGFDCVYGDAWLINVGGKYYKKSYPIKYICYRGAFIHQSLFVRFKIMKEYGFDVKYDICADYDLFVRLYINHCRFKQINIQISNYSLDGVSQTQTKQVRQQWKSIQIDKGIYGTMRMRRFIYEKIVLNLKTNSGLRSLYAFWCNKKFIFDNGVSQNNHETTQI